MNTELLSFPSCGLWKSFEAMASFCSSTQILVSKCHSSLKETRAPKREGWLQVLENYEMKSDISKLKMNDIFKILKIKRHFHYHHSLANNLLTYEWLSSFSAFFTCSGFRFTMQQSRPSICKVTGYKINI